NQKIGFDTTFGVQDPADERSTLRDQCPAEFEVHFLMWASLQELIKHIEIRFKISIRIPVGVVVVHTEPSAYIQNRYGSTSFFEPIFPFVYLHTKAFEDVHVGDLRSDMEMQAQQLNVLTFSQYRGCLF